MPARRTGVIHAWDGDAPADFAIDGPVPVYVRDPLTREVLGKGVVAAGRVESGDLWADIDWPEDLERRAGDTTPSARCKFDESGRLVRVVVELDDDATGPAGLPDGEYAAPPTRAPSYPNPSDPGREAGSDGPPLSRRQAEMAANESMQSHEDATHRDQAETAGRDEAGNPVRFKSPAEIEAENARLARQLAETNRKAKADRLRVEEFEKLQREQEEAKLGEADRIKRDRDAANQARQAAENAAKAAREELDRFRLDLEIERLAGPSGFNFTYPENAPRLIDRELIDYDEDTGKPLNLKDVLKKLLERQPNLANVQPRGGTPPRTGPMPRGGAPDPRHNEPMNIIDDLRRKVNYPGR